MPYGSLSVYVKTGFMDDNEHIIYGGDSWANTLSYSIKGNFRAGYSQTRYNGGVAFHMEITDESGLNGFDYVSSDYGGGERAVYKIVNGTRLLVARLGYAGNVLHSVERVNGTWKFGHGSEIDYEDASFSNLPVKTILFSLEGNGSDYYRDIKNIYLLSGQAELSVSAEGRTLCYIFSSDGSYADIPRDANSKVAFTIATQSKWTSMYINVAEDWHNTFGSALQGSYNLTIRLRGSGIAYFDGVNFWSYFVNVALHGTQHQPLTGAKINLFNPDRSPLEVEETNAEGVVIFYQVSRGNYTVEIEYEDKLDTLPINVIANSFYSVSLDVGLGIFSLPLNKVETVGIVAVSTAIMVLLVTILIKKRKGLRTGAHFEANDCTKHIYSEPLCCVSTLQEV